MDLAPIGDQRSHLEKCIDTQLGTALTSDKDTRIWPSGAGCTVNCMNALDKLFLKSQPLADRRRAIFHCKQTIGQKMSQLITEKENERFDVTASVRFGFVWVALSVVGTEFGRLLLSVVVYTGPL